MLRARGLSVSLGGRAILRGVTLPDVEEGTLLGVIGPNAAGKSTLLRCLTGELRAGDICLDGAAPQECSRVAWRRMAGYMPQTPPQAAGLSAVDLILSAARALELPLADEALDARIETIIADLGLRSFAFHPLSTLSGGQRQMVGFALALVAQPRLLLLDEPTSALDLRWRLKLLQALRDFVAKGKAAVAVLHDLDLASQFCDQLVLLSKGRVLAAGAPEAVLTPETIAEAYRVRAEVSRRDGGGVRLSLIDPLEDDN